MRVVRDRVAYTVKQARSFVILNRKVRWGRGASRTSVHSGALGLAHALSRSFAKP